MGEGTSSKLTRAYSKLEEHICLAFLAPAACFWARFLSWHFIWDEWLYVRLAGHVLHDPLNPLPAGYYWVPHPPLLWYLLCLSLLLPRLAILATSALCLLAVFMAARRLYGRRAAAYAVAVVLSSWNYVAYSIVIFTDMAVASFMAISALAFLAWLEEQEDKLLLTSFVAYALASLTKYTAAPILALTYVAWLVARREWLSRPRLLRALTCFLAANLPLCLWACYLLESVEDIGALYLSIYWHGAFSMPSDLVFYARYTALTVGVPLALWLARARELDEKTKLVALYVFINLAFFSCLRTVLHVYQRYDRYLLPVAPVAAVASGGLVAKEKPRLRLLMAFAMLAYEILLVHMAWATFLHAPTWETIEEILRPPQEQG